MRASRSVRTPSLNLLADPRPVREPHRRAIVPREPDHQPTISLAHADQAKRRPSEADAPCLRFDGARTSSSYRARTARIAPALELAGHLTRGTQPILTLLCVAQATVEARRRRLLIAKARVAVVESGAPIPGGSASGRCDARGAAR